MSKKEAIKNIKVELSEVTPPQNWITHLPLPLRFQHDKKARQEMDLNIDGEIMVEVFEYCYSPKNEINERFVLLHSLNDRLIEIYVRIVPMQFKIKITSENGGESIIMHFNFNPKEEDENKWVMSDEKEADA